MELYCCFNVFQFNDLSFCNYEKKLVKDKKYEFYHKQNNIKK